MALPAGGPSIERSAGRGKRSVDRTTLTPAQADQFAPVIGQNEERRPAICIVFSHGFADEISHLRLALIGCPAFGHEQPRRGETESFSVAAKKSEALAASHNLWRSLNFNEKMARRRGGK